MLAPRFSTYLEGRHHKRNAVRSYRNYLGILIRKAEELGWTPQNPEIPQSWEPVVAAIKGLKGGRGIVTFAISLGKIPSTLTNDDLNSWAQMMLVQKRDYQYVSRLQHDFRRMLSKAGLAKTLPGIFKDWKSAEPYFVPLSEFPPALHQEVSALLRWKQAPYVRSRKPRARLRAVSARNLQSIITQLYGFLGSGQEMRSAVDLDADQ